MTGESGVTPVRIAPKWNDLAICVTLTPEM